MENYKTVINNATNLKSQAETCIQLQEHTLKSSQDENKYECTCINSKSLTNVYSSLNNIEWIPDTRH